MPFPEFKGKFTIGGEPKDPIVPSVTPLLLIQRFGDFLDKRNLLNQLEKQIRGRKNVGFVDASFEAMMRSVGWWSSAAWCAFYVKLVLMQLFSFDREWLSKNLSGSAIGNLDSVKDANKRGDNRYVAFTEGNLSVGDVFVNKRPEGGHTGIILEVLDESTNRVRTIEGNTNTKKSGEGDKVLILERTLQVGKKSGSQTVVGFFRRNFTDAELEKLNYDEKTQTFVFTNSKFILEPQFGDNAKGNTNPMPSRDEILTKMQQGDFGSKL